MVEAQRLPWDFDGIIVGAPAINLSGVIRQLAWALQVNQRQDGSLMLNEQETQLLHRAVLDHCDMDDGIKDGLVSDPAHCNFNPATLLCSSTKRSHCLSHEQVEAANI